MNLKEELSKIVDIESIKLNHYNVYEDMVEKEYRTVSFSPSDVKDAQVIDVGAHIGMFSLLCQVHGARSITAIEANPKTFIELVSNLSKCKSVRDILNKAVFDGCINELNIIDKGTESRVTQEENVSFKGISCISLDQIINEHHGDDLVLKMDVEGAEYTILPSCSKKSLRKIKTIFLETHNISNDGNSLPGKTANFLKEYLKVMGFNQTHCSNMFHWEVVCNVVKSCDLIPNSEFLKFERD